MNKKIFLLLLILFVASNSFALAKPITHKNHSNRYYSDCHSSQLYLVRTEYHTEEQTFSDCDEHKMTAKTEVSIYSDGTSDSYTRYTLRNKDGSIIEDNCIDAHHFVYNKKHYFTYRKGRKYNLISADGEIISTRKYTSMREIAPNRLLVRVNKKYGVIDFNENIITPLKYKSIEEVRKNLFITKLNGYYGMMDSSNNILISNEYDKIKPLYETYVLKMSGKYGLADKNGKVILSANYDKIDNLGEYILVKNNKKYQVYNLDGKRISEKYYDKVRLKRNILQGKLENNEWVEISSSL